MKLLKIASAAVASFAAIASAAKVSIHAQVTDTLVDLGDLDTFWSVWQRMYDVSDAQGGLSDITRPAWNWNCQAKAEKAQLSTRVVLSGQWGAVPGYNGWQMRDTLIRSMWRTVEVAGQQHSYPIYRDCVGYGRERTPGNYGSACGPYSKNRCPNGGRCSKLLECSRFVWGHKIPSTVRINVYNKNGALRADNYQATFSSSSTIGKGGCGRLGAMVEVLAGFIPGVGSYVEKGIKIACRQ